MSSISFATNIAIIDTGQDYQHQDLKAKMWINSGEIDANNIDDERNSFVDDIYGWNFADSNNKIIDYKYLGTFPPEIYRYFEIQKKIHQGTATQEERDWVKTQLADKNYYNQLNKFATWIHGSHVMGIASENNNHASVMGIKVFKTVNPRALLGSWFGNLFQRFGDPATEEVIVKRYLKIGANDAIKIYLRAARYVGNQKGQVTNCSFGISIKNTMKVMPEVVMQILNRNPTPEENYKFSVFFVSEMLRQYEKMVDAVPTSLFVFSAGNDGTNNDVEIMAPANIKKNNTITVAASFGYGSLASFSNYGPAMVEVAAPGVIVKSTIPGHEYIEVSGTSQAAPFVTNIASQIIGINPKLTLPEVKKIIMETVDIKSFLTGKVASSGIANRERAIKAAEESKNLTLEEAIAKARATISDVKVYNFEKYSTEATETFMPTGIF